VATPDRTSLLAVYAAERADDACATTVAFAIATAGVTYVIAASAFLPSQCGPGHCKAGFPSWLAMTAPLIAITFVGFLVLNVAATRMRSVHLQRIEDELRIPFSSATSEVAGSFHSDAGLVYRPENLRERPRIRLVFAAITFVSYGTIIIVLYAFTAFVLVRVSGPWTWLKTIFAVLYGVVEILLALGFILPLSHPRFKYLHPAGGTQRLPH
jgi:hypothetical protein